MDIGAWLRGLGFGRYESIFIKNAIDTDVLLELTEADFEKLGIPLGDRKRLIKAIEAWHASAGGTVSANEVGEVRKAGRSARPPPSDVI